MPTKVLLTMFLTRPDLTPGSAPQRRFVRLGRVQSHGRGRGVGWPLPERLCDG